MKHHMIKAVKRGLNLLGFQGAINAVAGVKTFLPRIVCFVAVIEGLGVTSHRVMAIDNGILGGEVWLVEIISVDNIRSSKTRLNNQWSIRTN
jgi:hypothetical protein